MPSPGGPLTQRGPDFFFQKETGERKRSGGIPPGTPIPAPRGPVWICRVGRRERIPFSILRQPAMIRPAGAIPRQSEQSPTHALKKCPAKRGWGSRGVSPRSFFLSPVSFFEKKEMGPPPGRRPARRAQSRREKQKES